MHYQKYFTENANNIKNTWSGIKNIINIQSSTKGQPTSILIDDQFESDPTKVAEGFNNYFTSIAEKLQENIFSGNTNFAKYLSIPVEQNFLFKSVDTDEILLIINSFENSKAPGPHSIPTEILKLVKVSISYPLKEIINMSLQLELIPINSKLQ